MPLTKAGERAQPTAEIRPPQAQPVVEAAHVVLTIICVTHTAAGPFRSVGIPKELADKVDAGPRRCFDSHLVGWGVCVSLTRYGVFDHGC